MTNRYKKCWPMLLGILSMIALLLVFIVLPLTVGYLFTHPSRVSIDISPSDYNLPYEEVTFNTSDGLNLSGWFIPSQNGAVIILCHGYGDNRAAMLGEAVILAQHGYGTLLFDFRAHGESEGRTSTLGFAELEDALAAVGYLTSRRDVDTGRLGIIGYSMGADTAIRAAAHSQHIKAVVAEGAAPDLNEALEFVFLNQTGFPPFPFYSLTMFYGQILMGIRLKDVRPVSEIAKIRPRSLLLIQGLNDMQTPPDGGQRLFNAAGDPKELWQPPDTEHIAAFDVWPEKYEERVVTLFDNALK